LKAFSLKFGPGCVTGDAEVSFAHGLGGQAKHKISTEVLKHSLRALICSSYGSPVLKGHDFSRADKAK
jgi:hypothetical protein